MRKQFPSYPIAVSYEAKNVESFSGIDQNI